jgi:hypothetical protein
MVAISVGADVSVGDGVSVAVDEGFKVQVGRGVRVIVLVWVGELVGTEVNVDTRVIFNAGVPDELFAKLSKTLKNNNKAAMKTTISRNINGERFDVRSAILNIDYSRAALNSVRIGSIIPESKSNNGGFTLHNGKPCNLDNASFIIGGMGG